MGVLQRLEEPNTQEPKAPERGLHEGERLLAAHADALFGKARGTRSIRIMVTLPLKRRTTATSSKR